MIKIITRVATIGLIAFAATAQEPKAQNPGTFNVTLVLDNLPLADFVRFMTRITGADISFDSDDPKFRENATVSVRDKPWKPTFSSVLAQHGLLLVEDLPGARTYSVVRAASPVTASRLLTSQDAVALADAVLADLNAGNLDVAKNRLAKYREHNAEVVRTVQEKQPEPAHQSSVGTR
jgi:hypothetical protein